MESYLLTIPIPKQPWRWIRFRLSTILLLVAIVAIALAWRRDHEELSAELRRIQDPSRAWGVEQATGPPNTTGYGDIRTAWASATPDDQEEWLILEYDRSVTPTAILIHETYNPGAVYKVTHYPRFGFEKILWEGTDPTAPGTGGGVSRLPVSGRTKTGRIKIYINSPAVPGWNEIDAVGLEFGDPVSPDIIWAKRVEASTEYPSRVSPSTVPSPSTTGISLGSDIFWSEDGGVLLRTSPGERELE
jgi:hypothetical protein